MFQWKEGQLWERAGNGVCWCHTGLVCNLQGMLRSAGQPGKHPRDKTDETHPEQDEGLESTGRLGGRKKALHLVMYSLFPWGLKQPKHWKSLYPNSTPWQKKLWSVCLLWVFTDEPLITVKWGARVFMLYFSWNPGIFWNPSSVSVSLLPLPTFLQKETCRVFWSAAHGSSLLTHLEKAQLETSETETCTSC